MNNFTGVKSFIKNLFLYRHRQAFFSFSTIIALQNLLPLATLPWLARMLEPEAFGLLLYFCLFPPMVGLIMDWGLPLYGARQAALTRGRKPMLARLLKEIFSAKLLLCMLAALLALFYYPFLPVPFRLPFPYIMAILAGMARGLNPLWFFQGVKAHLPVLATLDALASLSILFSTFYFIKAPGDWPLYLLFLAMFKASIYGSASIWLYWRYKPGLNFLGGIKIIIKSSPFFGSALAQIICFNGTQLIFANWLTAEAMGILAAVTKMIRAFASLMQPFTQTIFPEVCILAQPGPAASYTFLRRSLILTMIGATGATAAVWLAAPWLIKIGLGGDYPEAAKVLQIMIWATPAMAVNSVLATQILAAWKMEKKQFYCLALGTGAALAAATIMGKDASLTLAACLPIGVETCLALAYVYLIIKSTGALSAQTSQNQAIQ